MSSQTQITATKAHVAAMRKRLDWLQTVPDGEFLIRDLHDDFPVNCMQSIGAIEITGQSGSTRRHTWQLSQAARGVIERYGDDRNTLCPCGHGGLVNHGEYYTCGFELCDRRFAREDIQQ
jgi:hypothetical protein